jgi:hypothetical protein
MQKEALRSKFADDLLAIVPDEAGESIDVAATLEDVVEEEVEA